MDWVASTRTPSRTRNVTYGLLVEKLKAARVTETGPNIGSMFTRGKLRDVPDPMSRSYWRIILTAAIVVLASVVAGLLIFANAHSLQRFYEHEAGKNVQQYRNAATKQIQTRCALIRPPERLECIAQAEENAREGERKEYDLQAQLVTSAWTRAMGLAAIIAMCVGILGVGLVYTTFRETRRAANAAHASNRAWLSIEITQVGKMFVSDQRVTLRVYYTVTNLGKSPALRVLTAAALAAKRGRGALVGSGIAVPGIAKRLEKWRDTSAEAGMSVFPTRYFEDSVDAQFEWEDIPGALEDGAAYIGFAIGVLYRFEGRVEMTVESFAVSTQPPPEQYRFPIKYAVRSEGETMLHQVSLVDDLASFAT